MSPQHYNQIIHGGFFLLMITMTEGTSTICKINSVQIKQNNTWFPQKKKEISIIFYLFTTSACLNVCISFKYIYKRDVKVEPTFLCRSNWLWESCGKLRRLPEGRSIPMRKPRQIQISLTKDSLWADITYTWSYKNLAAMFPLACRKNLTESLCCCFEQSSS